jgi:hypothetical protein
MRERCNILDHQINIGNNHSLYQVTDASAQRVGLPAAAGSWAPPGSNTPLKRDMAHFAVAKPAARGMLRDHGRENQ